MIKAEKYMQIAIKEAKKAYKKGDVPVGAVLVYKNKIISKNYNRKEKQKNAIKHAEILVIEKACKKLKTWHLEECELYITLEPCLMCSGAIFQSRIKKVYYSLKNNKFGKLEKINNEYINKIDINIGLCEKESLELLQTFFKEKRK